MGRIGSEIVQEKKKELASSAEKGGDEMLGKDVLSALIKANTQETGVGKMDDNEVLAQIATFMIAGALSPNIPELDG